MKRKEDEQYRLENHQENIFQLYAALSRSRSLVVGLLFGGAVAWSVGPNIFVKNPAYGTL